MRVAYTSHVDPQTRARLINAGILVGGTALFVGGVLAFTGGLDLRRWGTEGGAQPPLGPPDCNQVGPNGGTVAGLRYIERIRGNANPDDELPMVILFHSLGATPEGFAGALSTIGPARLILPAGPHGDTARKWFTKPIRSGAKDMDALVADWNRTAVQTRRFIEDITRCRPTLGKPVVTGSSQGGEMSYLIASKYPWLVRGAVAVLGWAPKPLWNPGMAPTIGLHGTKDKTVPYPWAKAYADAMIEAGAPFEWHEYDSGHAVSKPMAKKWRSSVKKMIGNA